MPSLANPRWERFAQLVAKGITRTQAYLDAGYAQSENRKITAERASDLYRRKDVRARVEELFAERDAKEAEAIQKAADKLSIDRGWVLERLVGEHERASECRNHGAAIRALELIGKELGMFIERRDVTLKYANLSDDALAAALARYVGEDEPRGEAQLLGTAH